MQFINLTRLICSRHTEVYDDNKLSSVRRVASLFHRRKPEINNNVLEFPLVK